MADESLGENVGPPGFRDKKGVAPEVAPREKVDPTSAEIAPRRRAADPERVAIDQGRKGKNRRHSVADQGGVEVTQSTGPNDNEYNEHYRSQDSQDDSLLCGTLLHKLPVAFHSPPSFYLCIRLNTAIMPHTSYIFFTLRGGERLQNARDFEQNVSDFATHFFVTWRMVGMMFCRERRIGMRWILSKMCPILRHIFF